MNRRAYIKGILILGSLSFTSLSVIKWFDLNKSLDPNLIALKKSLIAEIAELIIPETATPGAKSASVDEYIIKIVLNCLTPFQQHRFISGLNEVDSHSINKYKKSFINCNHSEQTSILQYFADHAGYSSKFFNKVNNKLLGEPFYIKFRNLTVEGYCLSKVGATQGLAYDYIPGRFEACIPIEKNQKSWATK